MRRSSLHMILSCISCRVLMICLFLSGAAVVYFHHSSFLYNLHELLKSSGSSTTSVGANRDAISSTGDLYCQKWFSFYFLEFLPFSLFGFYRDWLWSPCWLQDYSTPKLWSSRDLSSQHCFHSYSNKEKGHDSWTIFLPQWNWVCYIFYFSLCMSLVFELIHAPPHLLSGMKQFMIFK